MDSGVAGSNAVPDRHQTAEPQRVERLFHDIERENQLILRAAGEGIYGVNTEGKTTFVNPAAERLLGWKAEEIVGREMHATVHHSHADGSHYPDDRCPIYAAFRDGAVHQVEEEVFWRKDGTPLWVTYTSTPIRDRGVLVGAVIVFRDITQRRESDEKLRAALAEVDSLRARLELENAYLQEEIRIENNHRGVVGQSAAIQKVLQQVDLVAPTDAAVMIIGEAGTGKQLIARMIHHASGRSSRPLIRLNTAATASETFESELFGHVKGAFAGAMRDHTGLFELASGGTLFIDEICAFPADMQGKLVRAVREGRFCRVGESATRSANVRIIAATSRDLRHEVKAGRLREDLYFSLNVFPIEIPPLRERREDVGPLAAHFVRGARNKLKVSNLRLTEGDVRKLSRYDWPGNARELQNAIELAAILARKGRLRIDLPETPVPVRATIRPTGTIQVPVLTDEDRRARDRSNIVAALTACNGRVFGSRGAANLLGVKPTTLASRIKSLGINIERRPSQADSLT